MNYCSASLALECAGPPPYYTNDCVNPEVESKNLAITKLVLDVVDDMFGAYAHYTATFVCKRCLPFQLFPRVLHSLIHNLLMRASIVSHSSDLHLTSAKQITHLMCEKVPATTFHLQKAKGDHKK